MSAESIEHSPNPLHSYFEKLGKLVVGQFEPEPHQSPAELIFSEIDPAFYEQGDNSRKISLVATLIKEQFQTLPVNIGADEREAKRAQLRAENVRFVFKTFGLIPNSDKVNEPFSLLYHQHEDATVSMDREILSNLADEHKDHPAIRVLGILRNISKIKDDDVVLMLRTTLSMLDKHTS